MLFTYPDDLTMNSYRQCKPAKPAEQDDPPGFTRPDPATYQPDDCDDALKKLNRPTFLLIRIKKRHGRNKSFYRSRRLQLL